MERVENEYTTDLPIVCLVEAFSQLRFLFPDSSSYLEVDKKPSRTGSKLKSSHLIASDSPSKPSPSYLSAFLYVVMLLLLLGYS